MRVLVVDDEASIADLLSMALRYERWDIRTAGDGTTAVREAREFRPDAVILDVMLPDIDGLEVLRRLRAEGPEIPVLFLTARDAVEDRVAGITVGGDDYVTKPFSLEEVVARIRGLLRRAEASAARDASVIAVGDLTLDEDSHEVFRGGDEIAVTATEFELLRYLMRNPRRVLSKAQILDRVWKYDCGGQAAGTLGARREGSTIVQAGVLGENGAITQLAVGTVAALSDVPVDGQPHTLQVGDRGQCRLVATRTQDGDVLVTGLSLRRVDTTVGRLVLVEAAVAGIALALAMGAGFVIVRRTLRPLRRVASTATRVSQLQLDRGEVALAERVSDPDTDPRTEVGQVGGALNRMLEHVTHALTARQASETRVRRFVADASHELRTPLASIRGYAELTRRNREAVPPDFAYALERVESEAQRMTTMVEDLLLLARLNSGRPLTAEPVDLTRLVIDAVSDAQAAGDDHRWQLDLPEGPVTVTGDAPSLHQVLTNLLANARTHTPPGTTVIASVASSQPGTVVITVLDDGPGIAPEALPTVFDRFARGVESRTRTAGGAGSTGLGLSIVTAHHGTVHVTSHPGQTAFLVRLPTVTA